MDAIVSARPEWTPDTAHGYHGLTLGYVPNRGSELIEGNDLRINNLVAALYESVDGITG